MSELLDIQKEALASFMVDLPPRAHAIVISGGLPLADVMECATDAASALDEAVLVAPGGTDEADVSETFLEYARGGSLRLRERVDREHAKGRAGVLVVVDAEAETRAGGLGMHLRAERALHREVPEGARVVCVYTVALLDDAGCLGALAIGSDHTHVMTIPAWEEGT